ncbi:MAG: tetratricopeptide repeat protein [Candidatus Muirbacterium halophilum]|nr:tetratricopeptide repeat protein [Candidatus Muirbacterium halophilum]MCK9474599.1 tetratricopeptide repeat protein [Candidatus Muirbacterium halophilum]
MDNSITVDAFVLGYKRTENLEKVIRGIRRQSFIRDIYIFHNAPSDRKIEGVYNIFSERNFGCFARHVFALMTDSDYNLFIDDDIELMVDFSERFCRALSENPQSVCGILGRDISEKKRKYSEGYSRYFSLYPRYVDVVLGFIHCCSNELLLNTVEFVRNYTGKIRGLSFGEFIMDDLILNLSAQNRFKVPSIVVSSKRTEFDFLSSDCSQCGKSDHFSTRDILIEEFMRLGWSSLVKDNFSDFNDKNAEIYSDIENNIKKISDSVINKEIFSDDKIFEEVYESISFLLKYNYASLLLEKKEVYRAEKIFHKILEDFDYFEPSEILALSYFKLGEISRYRGNNKNSLMHYKKCLNIMPNHKNAEMMIKALSENS